MNKKEYLKQMARIQQIITCNEQELNDLEARKGIYAGTDEEEGIIQLGAKIRGDILRMTEMRDKIRFGLENLVDLEERLVLQRRYLLGETWKEVAYRLEMSESRMFRVHQSALDHLVLD